MGEMVLHASHPCIIHIDKDNYLLVFHQEKFKKSYFYDLCRIKTWYYKNS